MTEDTESAVSGTSAVLRCDRRGALAWVAGAGCVALALPARAAARDRAEEEGGAVTANEDLMREHGVLRRLLIVYREVAPRVAERPASVDARALADAARLFRRFGERYHEQLLEERHIFPMVRRAGGAAAGLVDTLLAQHARGRAITDYVVDRTRGGAVRGGDAAALAKALWGFARMYEAHAAREDTVVFPAFKRAAGPKGYAELGERFEDIERREFGGDGFDMAVAKVAAIEQALGLADLAAFTAAPVPVRG